MRNWLMQFMGAEKSCSLLSVGCTPRKAVGWFSLSLKAREPGELTVVNPSLRAKDIGWAVIVRQGKGGEFLFFLSFAPFRPSMDGVMPKLHLEDSNLLYRVHLFKCSAHPETYSQTHPEIMFNLGPSGQSSNHIKLTIILPPEDAMQDLKLAWLPSMPCFFFLPFFQGHFLHNALTLKPSS